MAAARSASGFSTKARRSAGPSPSGGTAKLEVAVARLRAVGPDAEGHDAPRLGRGLRRLDHAAEERVVGDDVVGGRHEQERVGLDRERGREDRGGRVARLGLDEERARREADGLELLGDDEAEGLGRDHDRRAEGRPGQAPGRPLEQALGPEERRELLGEALAGQGQSRVPEPPQRRTGVIMRRLPCGVAHHSGRGGGVKARG
jgi:hypothetical protein